MEKKKSACQKAKDPVCVNGAKKSQGKKWIKPTLEDVSEKVMAQPYIRFT
jgi:hypothetical protein